MEKVYDTDVTQNAVALVPEHEMLTVDSVKKKEFCRLTGSADFVCSQWCVLIFWDCSAERSRLSRP